MRRIFITLSLFLSCLALVFSLSAYFTKPKVATVGEDQEAFKAKLLHLVRQCVNYNEEMAEREKVLNLINEIERNDYSLEQGSDDLRVKFVLSQGCIEHVLACSQALGEIDELVGMIHTPTPATPLCTLPANVDTTLLDESIRFNLDKLLTVRSRAQIVREYLIKGGILYCVYPQGGLERRSLEQQSVYLAELNRYPNNLFDWVLNCQKMHPDMIGATYFFKDKQKQLYAFSIKARQANDPQEKSEWGIWLAEVKRPSLKARIGSLFDYLQIVEGPSPSHFGLRQGYLS